jgi:hypothetical protein
VSTPVKASLQFALSAFLVVMAIDAALSLGFQPAPEPENRRTFLLSHGAFHAAVLVLSAIGACVGFFLVRERIPSSRLNVALATTYGIATTVTAFGAFVLSGLLGVAAWLLLGSMSFAIGGALFTKPWKRAE